MFYLFSVNTEHALSTRRGGLRELLKPFPGPNLSPSCWQQWCTAVYWHCVHPSFCLQPAQCQRGSTAGLSLLAVNVAVIRFHPIWCRFFDVLFLARNLFVFQASNLFRIKLKSNRRSYLHKAVDVAADIVAQFPADIQFPSYDSPCCPCGDSRVLSWTADRRWKAANAQQILQGIACIQQQQLWMPQMVLDPFRASAPKFLLVNALKKISQVTIVQNCA